MPHLGTYLTTWAEKLHLNDRHPQRVAHVASPNTDVTYPDLVHTIGHMGHCSLCEGPHYETSCHKFINHVMGEKFLKEKDAIVWKIKRENTTFIKSNPHPHNGQHTTPGVLLIKDDPSIHDDGTLAALDRLAHNSRLSLIVDPIIINEQEFNCDDGGSCASVDSK
jgi:hypothetical protein